MHPTIALTQALIERPSITPDDQGCQDILGKRLRALNFTVESLAFDEVDNMWAYHGDKQPLFIFLGHTDVVPPGPIEQWQSPPFKPTIRDGYLYGRGSADMKSGVAAFMVALEQFFEKHPQHQGSVGMLITSDEEGPSINGVKRVMEHFKQQNIQIAHCLVGEASSEHVFGDTIKVGRRGTLSGELRIIGKQGHIAYPQKSDNPIHRAMPALASLCATQWDDGYENFPPTSFQISNINAGTGANNIIPGECHLLFNFRYSPAVTSQLLQQRVTSVLEKAELNYEITWHANGDPFYTPNGKLREATIQALQEVCQITPNCSTAGGTSDGRFVAPTGAEVIELGPINASIHKIDEHIELNELIKLTDTYERVLELMLL